MSISEVEWREWGRQAFAESRKTKKPILLCISASWCHWCHTMDRNTYSNRAIAERINRTTIPVRVDTDKRPDINARYNAGGWPTTLLITADGTRLAVATYVPPEGMLAFLDEGLARTKTGFTQKSHRDRPETGSGTLKITGVGSLAAASAKIISDIKSAYDPTHGGFGTSPKFPMHNAIEMLQHLEPQNGIVTHTLLKMAAGEIYDHIEGGFYRYATQQDWSYPHFEKMLDDNARMLNHYLTAWRQTREHRFRQVAEQTLSFMLNRLLQDEGYFAGSQDADEGYCKLPISKRKIRGTPTIDRTCYSGWNSQAIIALWRANATLQREECREAALQAMRHIMERCAAPKGIKRTPDNRSPALLEDCAWTILALLETAQHARDRNWLDEAERLAKRVIKNFRQKDGGFTDRDGNEKGTPVRAWKDAAENALMARALITLSAMTGQQTYQALAKDALASAAGTVPMHGVHAAGFAIASELLGKGIDVITVVGEGGAHATEGLYRHALLATGPGAIVEFIDASDRKLLSLKGYAPKIMPSAYVCAKGRCTGPITDGEELMKLLGVKH